MSCDVYLNDDIILQFRNDDENKLSDDKIEYITEYCRYKPPLRFLFKTLIMEKDELESCFQRIAWFTGRFYQLFPKICPRFCHIDIRISEGYEHYAAEFFHILADVPRHIRFRLLFADLFPPVVYQFRQDLTYRLEESRGLLFAATEQKIKYLFTEKAIKKCG